MARPTIKDIAKILGISPSTVSRALKDHPDISEETKRKVKEVALQINYRPNPIALKLKTQRSKIIGVIVPQIVHYFFSSIIRGIEDYTYEKGYSVIIGISNEIMDREKMHIDTLLSSGVDGVLLSCTKQTTDCSHIKQLDNYNIPVVFFDRTCPGYKSDSVIVNDEISAYRATKYLIESGCRKIVHFKGPDKLLISHKRLTGYIEALKEYNIEINPDLIIKCDSFEGAKKTTQLLIDKGIKFDGIFAVNDDSALGALTTLKKNGIKIPEEVSVFGYSNSLISQVSEPKLSTVEQPGYEMGWNAAKILISRIENPGEHKPYTEVVSTKLILRETTRYLPDFEL